MPENRNKFKESFFLYENYKITDLNLDYEFVSRVVGERYAGIVKKCYHVIRGMEKLEKLCLSEWSGQEESYKNTDYVRMKCFELAIKEIGGAVA